MIECNKLFFHILISQENKFVLHSNRRSSYLKTIHLVSMATRHDIAKQEPKIRRKTFHKSVALAERREVDAVIEGSRSEQLPEEISETC